METKNVYEKPYIVEILLSAEKGFALSDQTGGSTDPMVMKSCDLDGR